VNTKTDILRNEFLQLCKVKALTGLNGNNKFSSLFLLKISQY